MIHSIESLYDGLATFVEILNRLTITASCPMNLQYFPMDRQLCYIEIESCKYNLYSPIIWQNSTKLNSTVQIFSNLPDISIMILQSYFWQKYRFDGGCFVWHFYWNCHRPYIVLYKGFCPLWDQKKSFCHLQNKYFESLKALTRCYTNIDLSNL